MEVKRGAEYKCFESNKKEKKRKEKNEWFFGLKPDLAVGEAADDTCFWLTEAALMLALRRSSAFVYSAVNDAFVEIWLPRAILNLPTFKKCALVAN